MSGIGPIRRSRRQRDRKVWYCALADWKAIPSSCASSLMICAIRVATTVVSSGSAEAALRAAGALCAAVDAVADSGRGTDDLIVQAREELPQTVRFWDRQGFREIRRYSPLVEMRRQVEVARTYTRSVVERGATVAEACLAKQTACDAATYVCDQAVQLHGGTGYMHGTEVERHYRDARILPIGGGATEVMLEEVAKRM